MIASCVDRIYALIENPYLSCDLVALDTNTTASSVNALVAKILTQFCEFPDELKKLAVDIESAQHKGDIDTVSKINHICRVLEKIKSCMELADRSLANECLALIEPLMCAVAFRNRHIKQEVDSHIQKIIEIFEQFEQSTCVDKECRLLKMKIKEVILHTTRNKLDLTYQLHLAVTEWEPIVEFKVPVGEINKLILKFLYYTDTRELLYLSKAIDGDWGELPLERRVKKVFMGQSLLGRKSFAVSEQQIRHQEDMKCLKEEMCIYNELKSKPHILQIYRSEIYSKSLLGAKVNYLVTEFCDRGELTNYLRVGFAQKLKFGREILRGVREIHACKYVHRDLKPNNIFIQSTENGMQAVIGDFGFACPEADCVLDKVKGTPFYLPIEILKNEKAHSYLSDAWSVGVLFSELFYHCLPFNDKITKISQLIKILSKFKLKEPEDPLSVNYAIWGLLQKESSRMHISEALAILEQVNAPPTT